MHISYTLAVLLLIYLTYLISRYATLYTGDTDFQSNTSQVNGTPIFVALIQHADSPSTNIKAIRESWLQGIDNYVFSEKEGTWRDHSRRIRFPPTIRGDVQQIRWIAAYVSEIIRSQADWFLITFDDSYVIMENLMSLGAELPVDEPAYSFVKTANGKKFHALFLNRAALKFLSKAYSLNICASRDLKTLQSCFGRLGQAKRFDIEKDSNGRDRFLVQHRHMILNELKETSKNGPYSDGGPEFEQLSNQAHSFYKLNTKEITWYHALAKGMQHFAQ